MEKKSMELIAVVRYWVAFFSWCTLWGWFGDVTNGILKFWKYHCNQNSGLTFLKKTKAKIIVKPVYDVKFAEIMSKSGKNYVREWADRWSKRLLRVTKFLVITSFWWKTCIFLSPTTLLCDDVANWNFLSQMRPRATLALYFQFLNLIKFRSSNEPHKVHQLKKVTQ